MFLLTRSVSEPEMQHHQLCLHEVENVFVSLSQSLAIYLTTGKQYANKLCFRGTHEAEKEI
jgi:hypothetical protein